MNLRTKMQWNDYFKGYSPIFLLFLSRRQAKTKLNPKQSVTSLLFSNKIHTQNFCDSLSCQACDSGVFCHSMHSSLLLSVLSVLSDEHFPSFSQILLCRSSVEHIQHSSVFVAYFELKTPKSNSIFSLNFFIFQKRIERNCLRH